MCPWQVHPNAAAGPAVARATEQGQRLRAGAGRPEFSDLGFEPDQLFEVRVDDGGRRLVLETEKRDFSVEAGLAAGRP